MDQPSESRGVVDRAGFGQRLGAYIIDSLILGLAGTVLQALLFPDAGQMREGWSFRPRETFLSVLLSVLYFGLLEGRPSGQTVGKRILRIRVVDFERGTPIDYRRAFARSIGKILSGIPLGLGYLWMLWDRDRQTWHDKLAYTTVANVGRLEGDETARD